MLHQLSFRRSPYQSFSYLVLLYAFALFFAACISPVIYHLIQYWASIMPNDLNQYLARKSFDDYFDRMRWIPLIVAFIWLVRTGKIEFWKKEDVYRKNNSMISVYIKGICMGGLLMLFIVVVQYFFTDFTYEAHAFNFTNLVSIFSKAMLSAFVVGMLEEIVFRGIVLQALKSAFKPITAILLGALVFAYMHFKMPGAIWEATDQTVSWDSGFFVAYYTLFGVFYSFKLILFLNLFAMGLYLGVVIFRTGSLVYCIGMHSMFIVFLLSYYKLFKVQSVEHLKWLLGGSEIVNGLLPAIILGIFSVFVFLKKNKDV